MGGDPTGTAPPAKEPIRLSFFTTGTVTMRTSQRSQPLDGRSVPLRQYRSFTDKTTTGPLPIGVFVVHHPDGPILFDTGESPHFNDSSYLPRLGFLAKMLNKVTITEKDGVLPQLKALGIDPKTLQAIVLSHLHHDHAGGLEELTKAAPDVPVLVGRDHWEAFGLHRTWASVQGCAPNHWPPSFSPRLLLPDHTCPVGPWESSYPITPDKRVVAVSTPGHVPGHLSLVVFGGTDSETGGKETMYFLPGDAVYGIDLLDKEEPDGINDNPQEAVRSLKKIKELCWHRGDVVVLPSHDPDVERLLRDKVVYRPKEEPPKRGGGENYIY